MNNPLFDSWRDTFLDVIGESAIAAPLMEASKTENLRVWTMCLTSAVVNSCGRLGWQAAAKGHRLLALPQAGEEYLGIDVMAFPATTESIRWPSPIAAFELENHRSDNRVAYSLWKVLCVRSQLRVVFAFRRDWEKSRATIEAIRRDVVGSLSLIERGNILGETVVVIGNRSGETFPWGYFKFWLLDLNQGRFEGYRLTHSGSGG